MKQNDIYTLGYLPAREHDKTVPAEGKNLRFDQVFKQNEDTHYTDLRNHGDLAGLFYWEFNNEINDFVLVEEKPIPGVAKARQQAVSQFMELKKGRNFGIRNVGSWSHVVPAVQINQDGTTKPIVSKIGGVDEGYAPKTMKFTGFLGDSAVPDGNFDRDIIKNATGTRIPNGFPFLVVQCLNSESYEQLGFPAGNFLCLDNSVNGLSTKVARVKEDGSLEADGEIASLGSLMVATKNEGGQKILAINAHLNKEDNETGHGAILVQDDAGNVHLCYLSSARGGIFKCGVAPDPLEVISAQGNSDYLNVQRLAIDTEARYYRSDEKDGKLAFSDILFPTITGDDEVVEVILGFDTVTRSWRWFVQQELSQQLIARVAWNFVEEDLSEGELLGLAPDSEIQPLVWIDYELSKNIVFDTAGTETRFIVALVQKNFSRQGEVRDLYKVIRAEGDTGHKIRFVEIENRDTRSYKLLKSVESNKPWLEPDNVVKTLIGSNEKPNVIRINLPEQWNLTNTNADFRFLERNADLPRLNCFYAPIAPTPKDENFVDDLIFKSFEEISAETTISTYALHQNRDGVDGKQNAVTAGAHMMPIFGSPKRSIVMDNIDQEDTKICKIISYDPTNGVMRAKNLFDENKIFDVACFVTGQPGIRPSPDQVATDGIVTIHRVKDFDNTPQGQTSIPGQNVVDWVSLFFLAEEVTFDLLVVDNPPLIGQVIPSETVFGAKTENSFVALNLKKVTDFVAFSTGGARVINSESHLFICDSTTNIVALTDEKVDCQNPTGKSIYSVVARKVKVGNVSAFLVLGNSNFRFSAQCCEEEEEVTEGPFDYQHLTPVIVRSFRSSGVLNSTLTGVFALNPPSTSLNFFTYVSGGGSIVVIRPRDSATGLPNGNLRVGALQKQSGNQNNPFGEYLRLPPLGGNNVDRITVDPA